MTLRYSNKPVVFYGERPPADVENQYQRLGAHAHPIETAPEHGNKPLFIFEPNGKWHRAVYYRGAWRTLVSEQDSFTGAKRLRMDGGTVSNPVAWASS